MWFISLHFLFLSLAVAATSYHYAKKNHTQKPNMQSRWIEYVWIWYFYVKQVKTANTNGKTIFPLFVCHFSSIEMDCVSMRGISIGAHIQTRDIRARFLCMVQRSVFEATEPVYQRKIERRGVVTNTAIYIRFPWPLSMIVTDIFIFRTICSSTWLIDTSIVCQIGFHIILWFSRVMHTSDL